MNIWHFISLFLNKFWYIFMDSSFKHFDLVFKCSLYTNLISVVYKEGSYDCNLKLLIDHMVMCKYENNSLSRNSNVLLRYSMLKQIILDFSSNMITLIQSSVSIFIYHWIFLLSITVILSFSGGRLKWIAFYSVYLTSPSANID